MPPGPIHRVTWSVVFRSVRADAASLCRDAGETSAAQNGDELAAEIVIQPTVEDRVGTGRAERYQMTHGKDELPRDTVVTSDVIQWRNCARDNQFCVKTSLISDAVVAAV